MSEFKFKPVNENVSLSVNEKGPAKQYILLHEKRGTIHMVGRQGHRGV